MNITHTSGSNMCLILRQGVGEQGGELGLPVIVSNACPCQTLLLRRGVDCSGNTLLPTRWKARITKTFCWQSTAQLYTQKP